MLGRILKKRVFRTSRGETFQPLGYWNARHKRHFGDYRAVVNALLTEDANAEQYEVKRTLIAEAIRRHVTVANSRRLLDAGCGVGLLTPAYVAMGFDVTAVDFAATAVNAAQARAPEAMFHVASLSEFEASKPFDVIALIDVLLHVVDDVEWQKTLNNLSRHLVPGGILVIIDWIDGDPALQAPHCVTRSMERYQSAIAEAGLYIDRTERFELVHEGATKHLIVARPAVDR